MILAKNTFHDCLVYCGIPCCATDRLTIDGETGEKLNYVKLKKNIKAWMSSGNVTRVCLFIIRTIMYRDRGPSVVECV